MVKENIEIISYGEPLVSLYSPKDRSLTENLPLSRGWGGDTLDTTLALSKLGYSVAFLTRISNDEFGDNLTTLLRNTGSDTSLLQKDLNHSTGICFVSYKGEKHNFIYYRKNSAACFIDAEAINWELVRSARVLHLSSISQGISRNALEVSFRLMEFARKHGLLVSYDINYRPPLWNRETARAVILHTISEYVDILQMTDEELLLLGWEADIDVFIRRLSRAPRLTALKLGERGCLLLRGDERVEVGAFKVEVADTVGAGDAFDAGLIAGVLEGLELEELGLRANAVAALTCRDVGPLRAQPGRDDVDEFLR